MHFAEMHILIHTFIHILKFIFWYLPINVFFLFNGIFYSSETHIKSLKHWLLAISNYQCHKPALLLHSKNTCVAYTQVCVLQNTTLLSYMKDTRLCWFNTSTCVGTDNTSLVWYMSQHTKKHSAASEGRTHDLMHHRWVFYHWAITDTSYNGTIVIFIVTLTIMHIMAKLQYIDAAMCK